MVEVKYLDKKFNCRDKKKIYGNGNWVPLIPISGKMHFEGL